MRYACGGLAICITAVFSTAAPADPPTPIVTLERPVFFIAPDQTDIAAAAGTYRVQEAGPSTLRLIPANPTATSAEVQIQAMTITHEETLTSPVALPVVEDGQCKQNPLPYGPRWNPVSCMMPAGMPGGLPSPPASYVDGSNMLHACLNNNTGAFSIVRSFNNCGYREVKVKLQLVP